MKHQTKIGDVLFAQWQIPKQASVLGPILCGRPVEVMAVDDDGITVVPLPRTYDDSETICVFLYDEQGRPSAIANDGTTVFLVCLGRDEVATN